MARGHGPYCPRSAVSTRASARRDCTHEPRPWSLYAVNASSVEKRNGIRHFEPRPAAPPSCANAMLQLFAPDTLDTTRRQNHARLFTRDAHNEATPELNVAKSPRAGRRERRLAPSRRTSHCQASRQRCVGDGSTSLRAKPARTRRARQGESRDLHTARCGRQCSLRRGGRCERLRAPLCCPQSGVPSRRRCIAHSSGTLRATSLV